MASKHIYSNLQDDFKTVESYKPPMVNSFSCHGVNYFIHNFELFGHLRRVSYLNLTEPTEDIRVHHRHRFFHAANQGRYAKPKVFAWLWVPSGLCSCSPWRPRHCVTLCRDTGREWLVPGGIRQEEVFKAQEDRPGMTPSCKCSEHPMQVGKDFANTSYKLRTQTRFEIRCKNLLP